VQPADTSLRPSLIAGRGVFASAALAEGTPVGGPLNHSCDPNTWYVGEQLVTRRPIDADEELTYDYATGIADLGDRPLWCHCETYRCRQVIEPTDWSIPQLQKRYAGHWLTPLQQLIDNDTSTLHQ
jgi:hypothetical protein